MASDDTAVLTRHRLTSDEYYLAAKTGVLKPEDRVELIEGEIIDMAPIGPDHEGAVMGLNRALVLACGDMGLVSPQNSIRLGDWSAPQPDFAVFRPRDDFYAKGERAGPSDTLLVVEVSDTSLHYDRTVKLPLYARYGIGEVWILDVKRRALTAHRDLSSGAYRTAVTYQAGEIVTLALEPGIAVTLMF